MNKAIRCAFDGVMNAGVCVDRQMVNEAIRTGESGDAHLQGLC